MPRPASALERLEHFLARGRGSHHGADMIMLRREDRLVDAQHDFGHGDGKLDAAEELPLVQPETMPASSIRAALPDALIGVAHRRHDGECDGAIRAVTSPTRRS